jgi:peptidoglycan hydrolase CwlO-like protein
MRTIFADATAPLCAITGDILNNVKISFILVDAVNKKPVTAWQVSSGKHLGKISAATETNEFGEFSISLFENDTLSPATMYLCQVHSVRGDLFYASLNSDTTDLSFIDFFANSQTLTTAELSALQTHIANTDVHLSNADRSSLNAIINVTNLTASVNATNTNVANLTNSLNSTNGNVTNLTASVNATNANVTNLTNSLNVTNGNVTNLTASVNATNTNVANLTNSLNSTNGNVTNLTASVNATNTNVTNLTNSLNSTNGNVTNLTASVNATNTSVTNLTNSLNSTNGNVTNLTASVNATNTSVTNLTNSLNGTNGNVTNLTASVNATNTSVTNLTNSLNSTNGNVTNLTASISNLNNATVNLTNNQTLSGYKLFTNALTIADTASAVTGNATGSALFVNQTFNTTGIASVITVNLTNIASNANSNFITLLLNGTTRTYINEYGGMSLNVGSSATVAGNILLGVPGGSPGITITTGTSGANRFDYVVSAANGLQITAQGKTQLNFKTSGEMFFGTTSGTGIQFGAYCVKFSSFAPTTRPAYYAGAMYFDVWGSKLAVGGATNYEFALSGITLLIGGGAVNGYLTTDYLTASTSNQLILAEGYFLALRYKLLVASADGSSNLLTISGDIQALKIGSAITLAQSAQTRLEIGTVSGCTLTVAVDQATSAITFFLNKNGMNLKAKLETWEMRF